MNAAERLLDIHTKLTNEGGEQKMQSVWASVFGIEANPDQVIDAQQALKAQIDAVRGSLDAMGVPRDLQDPGLSRLREVAALHPREQWKSHMGNLAVPECAHCLRLVVWVLRHEEEGSMDDATKASLVKELHELEEAAKQPEISTYLRGFILRQVHTIEAALRLYTVAGVKPMKEALRKVAGDLVVERPHLDKEMADASPETVGTLAKVGRYIEKTAKVCDHLDKVKKFGDTAYALGQTVAPYISTAINSLKGP